MSIEAMKQALEALEEINELSIGENAICLPAEIDTAMDSLRQAIEQAEKQEPVALKNGECWPEYVMEEWDYWRKQIADGDKGSAPRDWFEELAELKLVTAQPQREWVGLTDEELKPLCDENHIIYGAYAVDFIQSIEAKLKEKNT
jgi:hypothetical protein